MEARTISCGECARPIPAAVWNLLEPVRCSGCGSTIQAVVFPAIGGVRAGAAPEALGEDSEASCFFHSESRAAAPCEHCGRFLCTLCDIETDSRHLCPACFEASAATGQLGPVETTRTMYDTMALALATLPAILIWPVLVSAPWALWIVFRRWRAPSSAVPRTRVRFYLAALIALAEIAGIVLLIWMLAVSRTPSGNRPQMI